MANATSSQLQQLYIAYFARPGDPPGLDYWTEAGITTKAFAANMYLQPEFQDVYGELSVKDQINQLYINLFNREGDDSGLEYWAGEIYSGNMELASIANDLIYAANHAEGSEEDLACLKNRTSAAEAYTQLRKELLPPPWTIWPPIDWRIVLGNQTKLNEVAKEWMKGICESIAIPTEKLFILSDNSPITVLNSRENLLVKEQESEELINTESNEISDLECGCNKQLETLSIEDGLYSSLGNSYVDKSLVDDSPYGLSPSNNTIIDLTVYVDNFL